MTRRFEDVRQGFDTDCDVVVVGSGAAGAVAATNLAAAGLETVVLEAGPELTPRDMTRDGPRFLARYFWEGGLRTIGGSSQIPSMQGRCLGGSTVVNSAIMLKLPEWVRDIWAREDGLDFLREPALDAAFERVFRETGTTPTPMAVMGRRNLIVRDALEAVGISGSPLPRAVVDCRGCADCLTGCIGGQKQSVDRCYLPRAERDGASVYTCAEVERVLAQGSRAVGVTGSIVDPDGLRRVARFTVHARRAVVLAAGVMATPVILQRSGLDGGRVGRSLYIHLAGGLVAVMPEPTDPWVGATQGWGAISKEIPGLKFESLWAPASVLSVRWGGQGEGFLRRLGEVRRSTVGVCVYRGKVDGSVRARRNGLPRMKVFIPRDEIRVLLRGLHQLANGFLDVGADYVFSAIPGTKDEMRTREDTAAMLDPRLRPRDVPMTANHVFGTCRMSADARRGAVDPHGKVYGTDNLYVCDTSVFPSGSAVNPQATVMALADLITRPLAERAA